MSLLMLLVGLPAISLLKQTWRRISGQATRRFHRYLVRLIQVLKFLFTQEYGLAKRRFFPTSGFVALMKF
jgi:hypothetical protein